jgi:pimeloyl-ACP methyl ester carboxylesterase
LNWYQFTTSLQAELRVFAEKRVEVLALFISGEKDWGMYQAPGNLERMMTMVSEKMGPAEEGCRVVQGAGHWVQQEQPEEVVRIITRFLDGNRATGSAGDQK